VTPDPTQPASLDDAPASSLPPQRSATVALSLSFLWPGLGQAYARHTKRALLFAIPIAVAILAGLVIVAGGVERLALAILSPATALAIILVVLIAGAWRILAMSDAVEVTNPRAWRQRSTVATFGILTLVTVLVHGALSVGLYSAYDAGQRIFGEVPTPSASPDPGESPGASAAPLPTTAIGSAPPEGERLTILITGIDAEPGRSTSLTDTMIIASVDPTTGESSMVSIPRDLARFELPDGRTYTGKINSLMAYAERHPDEFPDGPLPALLGTLGHLVGVPIPYYAAINLPGFVAVVDAVGGIDVDNQRDINDPGYGGWTDGRPIGFRLSAGPHHLDGQEALAYARSRRGSGDNDFTRARRQQEVLLALRARMTDPAVVPQIPSLMSALGDTVRTNFPPERLDEILELASMVDDDDVHRAVLGPRRYADRPTDTDLYILVPKMDAIEELSINFYGEDSRYWTTAALPSASPSVAP